MTAQNSNSSVLNHSDWPLVLERINQYMQTLELPVSQQTQALTQLITALDHQELSNNLHSQALRQLRVVLAGEHSDFSQSVVSHHYGFDGARNLAQRQWSMPPMSRSGMKPQSRPDTSIRTLSGRQASAG